MENLAEGWGIAVAIAGSSGRSRSAIRVRNSDKWGEVSVNGFEGENKEVLASIQLEVPLEPDKVTPPAAKPPPESQEGWLITGEYKSDAGGNQRGILASTGGEQVRAEAVAWVGCETSWRG